MSVPPTPPRTGLVLALLLALTAALTYPQVPLLPTHVGAHYDALFSIWRLAWFAHQLPRDPLHLFDANIFDPAKHTLAYSDALLFQNLLAAPALWAGADPVVVHNLLVLASFVAAGLAMYIWLVARGLSRGAALVGACVFAFPQYRFAHLPHLELLWSCWIPLAFWALERCFTRPSMRTGGMLGLCVAMQFWSSLYYGTFLVVSLCVLSIAFGIQARRQWPAGLGWAAAGALIVGGVLSLAYAAPYLATSELRKQRTGEAAGWSATPRNYLSTTHGSWLIRRPPVWLTESEGVLYPGVFVVLLAVVGVADSSDRRRVAYIALAAVATDLSLGVNGLLFEPLTRGVPPLGAVRVPARAFVIVSAALSVLAAGGAERVLRRFQSPHRTVAVSAALALVIVDAASVPLPLRPVPERPSHVYRWLRNQPTGVVVEWPLPRASSLGATRTPEYMYFSIEHWQPLAMGYSGLYPEEFFSLIEELATFPSGRALFNLQRRNVRYLVLHSQPDPAAYERARLALIDRSEVEFLFLDRTASEEFAVYRVHPKPSE